MLTAPLNSNQIIGTAWHQHLGDIYSFNKSDKWPTGLWDVTTSVKLSDQNKISTNIYSNTQGGTNNGDNYA